MLCADFGYEGLRPDGAERLIHADGEPSEALQGYQRRAQAQLRDREATERAIRALAEADVLAPWQVADVATLDGRVHYYVQLRALHRLEAEQQAELAAQGALGLAYAQAYAIANMRKLRRMHRQRQKRLPDLDQLFPTEDDADLDFDWSQLDSPEGE